MTNATQTDSNTSSLASNKNHPPAVSNLIDKVFSKEGGIPNVEVTVDTIHLKMENEDFKVQIPLTEVTFTDKHTGIATGVWPIWKEMESRNIHFLQKAKICLR